MPLKLIREDITKMKVDAVVNAANNTLLGGGGVDGAIHAAAGPRLLEECRTLGGCETGEAKITGGYNMPCKYIIHTVGPIWQGGGNNEEQLLYSCYRNSLELATRDEYACESVAFPLISSGIYGYPKAQALRVAERAITDFLENSDITVYLIIFDKRALEISEDIFGKIEQKVNDFYVAERERADIRRSAMHNIASFSLEAPLQKPKGRAKKEMRAEDEDIFGSVAGAEELHASKLESIKLDKEEEYVLDESFSEMLIRKIDELGITDPQCYKKANVDRRLFSRIRCNPKYKPSKQTALALGIALELPVDELSELIGKAGYALSPSLLGDVIVLTCLKEGIYNIITINEILFKHDMPILC